MSRRLPPHHDTLTCYTAYGCRLPACVERYREWNRDRINAKRAGQWQPHVDAEPVRQHLRLLAEHDISLRQAAELAGIGHQTAHALFRRPVRHTVRPEVAAAVLAVDPRTAVPTRVDPVGCGRRIQALVADGWPMGHLAGPLGVYRSYVQALTKRAEHGQLILSGTAAKVAEGYERLSTSSPRRHGVSPRLITQARNMGASRRWPPTAYWATRMDAIDDPHFEPMYRVTRREIIAQDAHELMKVSGLTRAEAAQRLEVSKAYVDHAFLKHPQYAVGVAV